MSVRCMILPCQTTFYFPWHKCHLSHEKSLKGLFHPAYLAHAVFLFAFVFATFMAHENGGKPSDDWMKQTL